MKILYFFLSQYISQKQKNQSVTWCPLTCCSNTLCRDSSFSHKSISHKVWLSVAVSVHPDTSWESFWRHTEDVFTLLRTLLLQKTQVLYGAGSVNGEMLNQEMCRTQMVEEHISSQISLYVTASRFPFIRSKGPKQTTGVSTYFWPWSVLTQQKTSEAESSSKCPMMIRASLSCNKQKRHWVFSCKPTVFYYIYIIIYWVPWASSRRCRRLQRDFLWKQPERQPSAAVSSDPSSSAQTKRIRSIKKDLVPSGLMSSNVKKK